MTKLSKEIQEGLYDPRSKYTALEKAILGVTTDKEVEEAHRKRVESTRQSVEADRQRKTIVIEKGKVRDYVRIHKDRNPIKWIVHNAPGWEYIGTLKSNTSGHYIPDSELEMYIEGLYDPKAVIRQITAKEWNAKRKHGYALIKNGQKYILRMNKGKTVLEPVKVYDPKKPKDFFAEVRRVSATRETGFIDINGKDAYVELIQMPFSTKWRASVMQPINRMGEIQIFNKKPELSQFPKDLRRSGVKRLFDPKASVIPTRWYEAMVKGIKKSSDVRNPYAIVKNIWAKLSLSKKAEIASREAKGERFKYNLPLPVDKPTRGTGTVRMVKPFKLAEVQVNLSVKDYLSALKSGIFSKMKREDGTTALVARCKSPEKNVNIFVDKAGAK